jgi:hypothetical protein
MKIRIFKNFNLSQQNQKKLWHHVTWLGNSPMKNWPKVSPSGAQPTKISTSLYAFIAPLDLNHGKNETHN